MSNVAVFDDKTPQYIQSLPLSLPLYASFRIRSSRTARLSADDRRIAMLKSAFEAKTGIFRAEKRPQSSGRNTVAIRISKQSVANASQTVSPNQQQPRHQLQHALTLKFNQPL